MNNTGVGIERLKRLADHHKMPTKNVGIVSFDSKSTVVDDEKNYDLKSIATTDSLDQDDEVIVPAGADMTYYDKNRQNFMDHKYDSGFCVGYMRSIKSFPDHSKSINQRGWTNRSTIYKGMRSPYADDLMTMARQGGIGCSIGFLCLDGSAPTDKDPMRWQKAGFVVRSWRMIELSYTAMPCNVDCRTMAEGPVDESKMVLLDSLVTKGRKGGGVELESAMAVGFPHKRIHAVTAPKIRKLLPLIIRLDRAAASV